MGLFTNASSERGFPALDDLPWRSRPERALNAARGLLGAEALSEELVSWLTTRPARQLEQILERSLERATHYKWFLGSRSAEYAVWLHEYKPPAVFEQATSFAASVHNHRYGFCSKVLRGALRVSTFTPPERPGEPISLIGHAHIDRGGIMALSHEDVHRIDQVAPHICTILVQGPPARGFSTCYDATDGSARRIYDMQSRLPRTLAVLAGEPQTDVHPGWTPTGTAAQPVPANEPPRSGLDRAKVSRAG